MLTLSIAFQTGTRVMARFGQFSKQVLYIKDDNVKSSLCDRKNANQLQSVRCLGLNQHLIRQKRHTFLVSLSLLDLILSNFWIAITFGYINQWREKTQLKQIGNSRKQIWFSSLACSTKIRPPCHELTGKAPEVGESLSKT